VTRSRAAAEVSHAAKSHPSCANIKAIVASTPGTGANHDKLFVAKPSFVANIYVANVSLIVGGGGDMESEWRSQFRTWMLSYDNVVDIYYFFPGIGALFLPPDSISCVRDACCTGSPAVPGRRVPSRIGTPGNKDGWARG
jgi:hypothetical protein